MNITQFYSKFQSRPVDSLIQMAYNDKHKFKISKKSNSSNNSRAVLIRLSFFNALWNKKIWSASWTALIGPLASFFSPSFFLFSRRLQYLASVKLGSPYDCNVQKLLYGRRVLLRIWDPSHLVVNWQEPIAWALKMTGRQPMAFLQYTCSMLAVAASKQAALLCFRVAPQNALQNQAKKLSKYEW